ncbi:MAG: MoxR family ATPase [Rhizobacter sp.]|nr:MoxR family ATPase [Ferruginibacter sp.]
MMNSEIVFYKGNKLLKKTAKVINKSMALEKTKEKKLVRPDPYIPSDKLIQAVQFAQVLGRPLLVKGEPGCGKSKLAEAIAYELFEHTGDFRKYYFEWHVKSNSKAQEGLYQINHLERLQEANITDPLVRRSTKIVLKKNENEGDYIELGPLGKIFQLTRSMDPTLPSPVLLIDEIDKADIDFPNDLLLELDKMEFTIKEAKNEDHKTVKIIANQNKKPLIIITSNDEKRLPPAFLRRCLFFYIDFPTPEQLFDIVDSRNFGGVAGEELLSASRLFSGLRFAIETEGTASKNITTSELLDWIRIINHYYKKKEKLFDIESNDSVSNFVNEYSAALAKDDATRIMFTDMTKSATVLNNAIEKYKEYVKKAAKTPETI